MEFLKTVITYLLRVCLHVFWLFPIRRNRLFFSAYSGHQYSCNPRAISEYLQQTYPDQGEILWCWQGDKPTPPEAAGVRFVRFQSLAYFRLLLTSQVVVFNDLQHCSYLPFRKHQLVVQTWHGCGLYKKVGRDTPQYGYWHLRRLEWIVSSLTLFLSGSSRFSETVVRGAFGYQGEILEAGLPRNDILLDKQRSAQATARVRQKLSLSPDVKIILYAPTFRNDGNGVTFLLDSHAVLNAAEKRWGAPCVLLIRSHYRLNETAALKASGDIINVTSYPDMQELLAAADVLISDYSSCIWDFSLTGKPCFIFADDLFAYQQERGFYLDIEQWPFPLAADNQQLIAEIEKFNDKAYELAVQAHLQALGNRETGQAAAAVGERLAQACGWTDASI